MSEKDQNKDEIKNGLTQPIEAKGKTKSEHAARTEKNRLITPLRIIFLLVLLVITLLFIFLGNNPWQNSGVINVFLSGFISLMITSIIFVLGKMIESVFETGVRKKILIVKEFLIHSVDYKVLFTTGLIGFLGLYLFTITNVTPSSNHKDIISNIIDIIDKSATPFVLVTLLLALNEKYKVWVKWQPKVDESDVLLVFSTDPVKGKSAIEKIKAENLKEYPKIKVVHAELPGDIVKENMKMVSEIIEKSLNEVSSHKPKYVHMTIQGPVFMGMIMGSVMSNNYSVYYYHLDNASAEYKNMGLVPNNLNQLINRY